MQSQKPATTVQTSKEIDSYTDENGVIWWNDILLGWISDKPDRFPNEYKY